MTSGFLISSPGLSAKPATREAPTSGRTFIGTSRQSRRWVIGNAVLSLRGLRLGL